MVHLLKNVYGFDMNIKRIPYQGFGTDGIEDFTSKGEPVPRELLPKSIDIGFETPVVMTDFFRWLHEILIVSDNLRGFFERLVPGYIDYIPVDIRFSNAKVECDRYFYANVLKKGPLIDFERCVYEEKKQMWDGDVVVHFHQPPLKPLDKGKTVFRDMPTYHVWHEVSQRQGKFRYIVSGYDFYMSDALWDAMNDAFPGQLSQDLKF